MGGEGRRPHPGAARSCAAAGSCYIRAVHRALACSAVLAAANFSCAASSTAGASNATKMGEAAVFAGAAAAAQVVQSAMEARARNSAPVQSLTGLRVTTPCDNEGQYPCVAVSGAGPVPAPAEREMTDDEARSYVTDYINGVRKLNDVPALAPDPVAEARAQAATERWSRGVRAGDAPPDPDVTLDAGHAEVEGSALAPGTGLIQDRLGEILLRWMDEKPDGPHRRALVSPQWRRLGIGVVTGAGRTFFAVDLSR